MINRPSPAITGIVAFVLGVLLLASGKSVFFNSPKVEIVNGDADARQNVEGEEANDSVSLESHAQDGEGCIYLISGDAGPESPEPVVGADVIVLGDDVFIYVEKQPTGQEHEDLRNCGERQRRANADWRAIR